MRVRLGLALVSLVCVSGSLAVAACSSSSTVAGGGGTHDGGSSGSGSGSGSKGLGDGGAPGATDAEIAACNAGANALCSLLSQCNPVGLVEDYADAGDCIGREFTNCELSLTVANTASSAAHTTGCAAAETSESCADYLDLNPPAACAQVHGGTAIGGACSHPGQCTTGFCAIAPGVACGTCQAVPAAGASCTDLTTCGPNLDCYKGTCVAYVTMVTGACSATQPCGTGLGCVIPSGSTAGTCQALGAMVGASCDPKSETAAACDFTKSLTCVSKTTLSTYQTCQPVVFTTAGMPCGYVEGFQNYCANGSCLNPNDAGFNCVGRAANGEPCNTIVGPDCTIPARCVGTSLDGGASGTCQEQSACP